MSPSGLGRFPCSRSAESSKVPKAGHGLWPEHWKQSSLGGLFEHVTSQSFPISPIKQTLLEMSWPETDPFHSTVDVKRCRKLAAGPGSWCTWGWGLPPVQQMTFAEIGHSCTRSVTARRLKRSWSHPIDQSFCALLGAWSVLENSFWLNSQKLDFHVEIRAWFILGTEGLSAWCSELRAWIIQRWAGAKTDERAERGKPGLKPQNEKAIQVNNSK